MEASQTQPLDYEGRELPERHEIVDGVLVKKASPSIQHAGLQRTLAVKLDPFHGPPGKSRPGGWWFGTEIDVQLASGQRYVPDMAGWRMGTFDANEFSERLTFDAVMVYSCPDWICEILSPSTASRDLGTKKRNYHLAGVGHYWVFDPTKRKLTVLHRGENAYRVILEAGARDTVQAEPFADIALDMSELFAMLP
ncbi:MAG: Uma2 family endonuclease [Proteobacteria bacterium]|nr:Uma2 family endonuclease [Pseudomonadota bacterium]